MVWYGGKRVNNFREHDKNPEMFFQVMFNLQQLGTNFKLIVIGLVLDKYSIEIVKVKNLKKFQKYLNLYGAACPIENREAYFYPNNENCNSSANSFSIKN